MIPGLPSYIPLLFGFTTLLTLLLLYWTLRDSGIETTRKNANRIVSGIAVWLVAQMILTIQNIYNERKNSIPPKIMLMGILPALLIVVMLFASKKGRNFIDSLPVRNMTYIHFVRIPVELTLYALLLHKAIPRLMTFEGRNFDILAGLSAPFIAYYGLTKKLISRKIIIAWNFICLALLANIVINALLSAPTGLQRFAFDQPNIAILNFPFSWLPTFIVPVVLFAHLASLRQLLKPVGR